MDSVPEKQPSVELGSNEEVARASQDDGKASIVSEPVRDVFYPTGWRLHAITFGMCFSLFMSLMDTSIASTSILLITDELGGFDKSSWAFTSYLLTYCGFSIIINKVSDIFGRKSLMIFSVAFFALFSGLCGASQTLIQFIMFRWLQGIGGSGIYAIGTLYFFEAVPPAKYPTYSTILSSVMSLSYIFAPLIGAAITSGGDWKWIFIMNVPMAAVAIAILTVAMPAKLDKEPAARWHQPLFSRISLRRLDVFGATFLLGSSLLLTTALQQAAEGISWTSGHVLGTLVAAAISCVALLWWEWYVTEKRAWPEPVLPWRFMKSAESIGMIVNAFLAGVVMIVAIVQIPQRLMVVNGLSAVDAGVRLLPFAALVPGASTIGAVIMTRFKVPPVYVLAIGAAIELAGVVGFSQTSASGGSGPAEPAPVSGALYGFMVLAGAGVGLFNIALVLMVPVLLDPRDLAVGTGAVAQFRTLGGLVGLAVATCASSPGLRKKLVSAVGGAAAKLLLDKTSEIKMVAPGEKVAVRQAFAESYNLQMLILVGTAAAHFPFVAMMWRRQNVRLET